MRLPQFTTRRLMRWVAAIGLICGGLTCGVQSLKNRLVVENLSGQPIVWLKVKLDNGGMLINRKNLPDRDAETAWFEFHGDNGFEIDGVLADGTKLNGNFGYVTNGDFGLRPHMVVGKGGKITYWD